MTWPFEKVRDRLIKQAQDNSPDSIVKGREREELVKTVLGEMKEEGIIFDYIQTSKYSIGDILDATDFYIIVIKNVRKNIPIQVTGSQFLQEHKNSHPDIPLVCVPDDGDRKGQIRTRIMLIINNY